MIDPIKNKLSDYIGSYLNLWDFFGVIQVIREKNVLFEGAYGYANMEFRVKNNMKSRFSIASMSKQFTAFSIMLLHDRGLIDLDSPARRYLPQDMQIDQSITIHHLLSHTSGLHNFYNFEDGFFGAGNRADYSQKSYFEKYIKMQPVAPAGSRFDYNNSNYNLLAWIIEYVSGESYGDFIRKNIFLPLGMANSELDDGCRIIQNRSCNYVMDYGTYVRCPYYNEKFSIGAGAIVSNCDDLYKWYKCLKERRLLSNESYLRFLKENQSNYCYGLEHHHVYGTSKYSHGGDHLGISTYMQNFFDEDICVIILSNNEAINQYRLGDAISDILHNIDADAPTKRSEAKMPEASLREYCGTYLKDKIEIELINGRLYFTRFCGNLHIELYPVGEGLFTWRYHDQLKPYSILRNQNGQLEFFGYSKDARNKCNL